MTAHPRNWLVDQGVPGFSAAVGVCLVEGCGFRCVNAERAATVSEMAEHEGSVHPEVAPQARRAQAMRRWRDKRDKAAAKECRSV